MNYSNIERPSTGPIYQAGAFTFSNLYKPSTVPVPTFTTFSNTLGETNLSSVGVADTLSILNNRIQFTAGVRRQTAGTSSTNALTGAGTTYEASVWSPAYAVLVRPLENVSVYANYIEGLQAGTVVASNFANRGEVLPPFQTKQMEAGVKVDFGRISTTVAAFEITRPSLITVGVAPNNSQVPDGEQRNRGVELNVFGELTPTVRVLGGVALIDGRLTKTQGGANDGRKAQGVADVNINLGAEWDLPFIPGLTVTGRMIHTGAAFINAGNTQSIPAWTRVDPRRALRIRLPVERKAHRRAVHRGKRRQRKLLVRLLHGRRHRHPGQPAHLPGIDHVQLRQRRQLQTSRGCIPAASHARRSSHVEANGHGQADFRSGQRCRR